jgi:tetratricopeptide (TPR) repeat protein
MEKFVTGTIWLIALLFTCVVNGGASNPLSQKDVLRLLADGVTTKRVEMLVKERGIDFEPQQDYLDQVRQAGGDDELITTLKGAKAAKPVAPVVPLAKAKPGDEQLDLALHLYAKHDYDGAAAAYREALRLDPNNGPWHLYLGFALEKKGDQQGALEEYRAALKLEPENPNFKGNCDRLSLLMAKPEAVAPTKPPTASVNPAVQQSNVHASFGVSLVQKGDVDGAIVEFRQALQLNPNNDSAHVLLGSALGNKHNWDGMVAEEREALRLNPNNAWAHSFLGIALGQKGDWDGEIAEERESLRLEPNNDATHNNLGVALEKKGDLKGAVEEYRAAYELNPKNALYKQNYERLLHHMKK